MLLSILSLDHTLSAFVSNLIPHNSFFDSVFLFLSLEGITVVIWALLICIFILFKRKKYKHLTIYLIISFMVTSFIVNIFLKNIFERDRPFIAQSIPTSFCPDNFSFPSGHAAGAFAVAGVIVWADPKRKWLYYGIAVMISLSRIYLYCHYMFDIVAGGFIGYFIAQATLRLLDINVLKRIKV